MAGIEHPQFSVDTGLFRQLGELLVGRDSTALVELIKNAYDADATSVVLEGQSLDDPEHAVLTVADNGTGMTGTQFRNGFLRLAARGKTEGERRSSIYQRRFTGEKGVGRLAAHKLAAVLDVTTVAAVDQDGTPLAVQLRTAQPGLETSELIQLLSQAARTLAIARIDWDLIESVSTLSDVHDGLVLETDTTDKASAMGTTLTLSRLRHIWTSLDLRDLVRQLNNFEPPQALAKRVPRAVLPRTLLFEEPIVRDANRNDPGLTLEFQGDFTNPEEFWGNVLRTAEWILEIRAAPGADITYAFAPTRVGESSNSFRRSLTASMPHPAPDRGPFFDARILLRSGRVPTTETAWTELNSGIRIYLEGFRVLPYGEPRNDWLSLDFDYTKRAGRFEIDPLLGGPRDDLASLRKLATRDVSLRLLPNRAFFGAVFLTDEGMGGLRTLVNREGFVPDEVYGRLVRMVNTGIRLVHRAHALASYSLKEHEEVLKREQIAAERAAEDNTATVGDRDETEPGGTEDRDYDSHDRFGNGDDGPDGQEEGNDDDDSSEGRGREWTVLGSDGATRGSAARLQAALADLWSALAWMQDGSSSAVQAGESTISILERSVREVEDASGRLIEDASLLRVLASVGSQLASFTHELSQLLPIAVAAENSLAPISGTRWPPEVTPARRAITDLRRALERQASYLVDVASTEGRRRRSRQLVRERVNAAFLAFQGTASVRNIELINGVGEDLRTPPLFRAELQAILSNLLSNAIKAAGSNGRIEVLGESVGRGVRIVIQNTGVAVQPEDAENWFKPYASTTTTVDLTLGQGMGLGLPITRDLLAEYGGTVHFIRPGKGFATAIEVLIPE